MKLNLSLVLKIIRFASQGFSQGCMMSINLGLTAEKEFSCIVGFSGKIIDQNDLKLRKKNSTKTLLIHGEQDQVVSPNYLLEAKDFFYEKQYKYRNTSN